MADPACPVIYLERTLCKTNDRGLREASTSTLAVQQEKVAAAFGRSLL